MQAPEAAAGRPSGLRIQLSACHAVEDTHWLTFERAHYPCQGNQALSTGHYGYGAVVVLCAMTASEDAARCPSGQSAQAMEHLRLLLRELLTCVCVRK